MAVMWSLLRKSILGPSESGKLGVFSVFKSKAVRGRKAGREKMFKMFVEIVALILNPLPEEVKSLKTQSIFFHIWRGNEIHKPTLEAGVSRAP